MKLIPRMKKHKIAILLIFLFSCQENEINYRTFHLHGESILIIKNETAEGMISSVSNWINLPVTEQRIDTVIAPGQSVEFYITTQSKHYFEIRLNDKNYRLFTKPNMITEITIPIEEDSIMFDGDLSKVNEFLQSRSVDSDWRPRGEWYQGAGSLSQLLAAFDSITEIQQKHLKNYEGLPAWYVDFENLRLEYVNARSKLSALVYRKVMLSGNDTIPPDYLNDAIGNLPIENEDFLGVTEYMRFLSSYLLYKADPRIENGIPRNKEEWIDDFESRIKSAERNIDKQYVKDIFLAMYFSKILEGNKHIWNDKWVDYISDTVLSSWVKKLNLENPILPPGEQLPYFYLANMDSIFFEPKDFSGKILLINFWATWCKPCYEEFDHEDFLVEKFKDEPIKIINICIDSEKETWRKVVNRNNLKTLNLFATAAWSENINKYFGISSLPHSILVDQNGKVIENNCPRPSAGVDALIMEALITMKNESHGRSL